ncbi:hypothetical protein R5R35_010435 [Gryllus longicercus]|uniref:Lysosome-associated membrane glycoprotein 2-like luminal domain-containing protein n=1 Tax=Gryllus longicercus TaxID=2509291 RepID=A0AAN9VQK2_9ORTH
MNRLGLALLLFQGSLFTSLATNVTTTPTPSPTTDKNQTETSAEIPLYKVNAKSGEVCILMELDAYVSINWAVSLNETKEMDMILQSSKVEATGSCSEEEAQIILTWKSFRLQWTFSKTRDWKKWFVKQVELQYDKSDLDHQNNATSGVITASTKSSSEVLLFSAPLGEAYHCASEEELDLGVTGSDSAMLRLRRFRLQPFLAKPEFGPGYCPTHISSSSYESSTPSSDSSEAGITKAATNLSLATSIPPHPSERPNVSTDQPLRTTSRNGFTGSTASSASSLNSHPPSSSAVPFSGSTKAPVLLDQTTHHEELPTTNPSGLMSTTAAPVASLPPYVYQKSLPNIVKMSYYPQKKMFLSGIKLDNNDALSAMLWSWYTSGFYTGYYQALQQSKKY